MNSLVWRARARTVAYVDLAYEALAGFLVVVGAVISATVQKDDDNWLSVVILLPLYGTMALQLYADLQILNGTDKDTELQMALTSSRFWRNCGILSIVVVIFADYILMGAIVMSADVVIRLAMLFVVIQFIRAVESAQNDNKLSIQTGVV